MAAALAAPSRGIAWPTLAVMAVVLLGLAWRLGDAPLAGTEGHRAVTAHEMVRTGQWLIPRIYGEQYLAKPPLHYWVLALSETLFGSTSEWVYRLPSVLATTLLAGALCLIAQRWFGPPAGIVSGLSFLGLIALWSQGGSADIDAVNTLLSVLAALGLLALGSWMVRRRWLWSIATGAALAGALLAKGPAGAPVMLAATLAPAVAARSWRPLRAAPMWIAWLLGLAAAGAWAAMAGWQVLGKDAETDLSGLDEVARNVTSAGLETLRSFSVPLEVLVYALPISLALPLALRRETISGIGEPSRQLVRGLAWTVILALLLGIAARITNPRYSFIVLPLLCPLAGAVAVAWARGWYSDAMRLRLRQLMTIVTVAWTVTAVVIAALVMRDRATFDPAMIAAALLAIAIGAWSVRQWITIRVARACAGLAALLIVCSFAFAAYKNQQRREISSRDAGFKLRELIGDAPVVTSGMWVMNGPELFHYAGVDVDYQREFLREPREFPSDRWIVFHSDEWANWSDRASELGLSHVAVLPTRKRNAILAWYDAP